MNARPGYRWLWGWDYAPSTFRFPFGIWTVYRNGVRAAEGRRGMRFPRRIPYFGWAAQMR